MPEIATQVEVRDTHRNVYTQCGGQRGATVSVIVEYRNWREIEARPREVMNHKRKQQKKPGMMVSTANMEKVKVQTHRKCVGTEDLGQEQEESEITILKEINDV